MQITGDTVDHPAAEYRIIAGENLRKQAAKMLRLSSKKLKEVAVNDCVTIQIPEFDRGKGDPANIIGIVLDKNDGNQFKIGTRGGVISSWMERNAFEPVHFRGLNKEDVPNVDASLREIVRNLSVGDGQGKKKCACKTGCASYRCACFKNKMKCNSACHSQLSIHKCTNHD